ncbi:MAG: class III extradiol ring-cleavage dioxygenase [Polyangiales bacterium]
MNDELSRRQLLAAAGATALGALHGCTTDRARPHAEQRTMTPTQPRTPVVYLPHGGGPWPFVDLHMGDPRELDALANYLRSLSTVSATRPRAVLMVSAHWEERVPTVMTSPRPPMLYDYYGFPPESYQITWPAPGDPTLAARVRALLGAQGIDSAESSDRGFDHGAFVPLKLTWPEADMPTVQLSLQAGLDPARHLAIGRALAPLRDEGVLILGSGMSYHNMQGFFRGGSSVAAHSTAFDQWLGETVALDAPARDQRLTAWASAPSARQSHPREEHLIPLMVIAGAAGADRGRTAYRGPLMNVTISAFHFG